MNDLGEIPAQRERVEQFLRERGAEGIPHPGGTLLAHLIRVGDTLAGWGAPVDVQLAGLSHATYGTDGFARALLPPEERGTLATLIGDHAEALVYLYGSCDRDAVYPQLHGSPVIFRDRFTGLAYEPPRSDLRAFVEITAANELDVLAHNGELAEKYSEALFQLFERAHHLLSAQAWQACREQLGPAT
ncbi:hypothetical protein JK358_31655 [Nocardia sp. 2]|uniref:DUF6817 domain-containing protein n=1 Tax=Nocardia acididurans TaxID=2802282 RepID=A0ABS1MFY1_9NOCA|nr:hypothetical protein [Nocardia acididurans]MBL1078970.1 hypothetical protein [Nocardia acididurans]